MKRNEITKYVHAKSNVLTFEEQDVKKLFGDLLLGGRGKKKK